MTNNKWGKAILNAIVYGIVFMAVLILIHLIRYSELLDLQLFTDFYLGILILGTAATIFSLKRFSIILYLGAAIGLIVECVTTYLQAGHPTMAGGIYNFLITAIFFIIAIVVQIIHQVKMKRAS